MCPSTLLARLSGKQHFLVPFNVLDLVYGQTVSWMGVYYCPLLPLIGTVTLTATVYIKKVAWTHVHVHVFVQRLESDAASPSSSWS